MTKTAPKGGTTSLACSWRRPVSPSIHLDHQQPLPENDPSCRSHPLDPRSGMIARRRDRGNRLEAAVVGKRAQRHAPRPGREFLRRRRHPASRPAAHPALGPRAREHRLCLGGGLDRHLLVPRLRQPNRTLTFNPDLSAGADHRHASRSGLFPTAPASVMAALSDKRPSPETTLDYNPEMGRITA